MTRKPTEVAAAAAERFRVLREQATTRLVKARSDATVLRARVQRESQEMMAEAKRRKNAGEPEERLLAPWPNQQAPARYRFDDSADDHPAPATETTPRPTPAPADTTHPDQDDEDNMSQVDTWLR